MMRTKEVEDEDMLRDSYYGIVMVIKYYIKGSIVYLKTHTRME